MKCAACIASSLTLIELAVVVPCVSHRPVGTSHEPCRRWLRQCIYLEYFRLRCWALFCQMDLEKVKTVSLKSTELLAALPVFPMIAIECHWVPLDCHGLHTTKAAKNAVLPLL